MKINWNKRYTTYAIYACIILAAIIFCVFLGVYVQDIWRGVLKVVDVFSPLLYGCAIAYILHPIVELFEKKVVSGIKNGVARRGISVAIAYLVFISAIALLVYAVVPQIVRSFNDLQSSLARYSEVLQEWVVSVSSGTGILATLVNKLSEYIDFSVLSQPITQVMDSVYKLLKDFSPYIMGFLSSFVVQLKNIVLGLVFAGYLLCSKELVFAQINKLMHVVFGEKRIKKIKDTVRYTDRTFGKYLMGTFADAVIVGLLTAVAMIIFRMPYIPLVSVLVACTNIIPIFGPFIGAIPSALFIFISDPIKAFWFVIIILVIQQIDGNFIAPRILGGSTGLPAIVVIIAITVMGGLFGIVGMIIAVPSFAVLAKLIDDKTKEKLAKKRAASESSVSDPEAESAPAAETTESEGEAE